MMIGFLNMDGFLNLKPFGPGRAVGKSVGVDTKDKWSTWLKSCCDQFF